MLRLALLVVASSCSAFSPSAGARGRHARLDVTAVHSTRMQMPDERWSSYRSTVTASENFASDGTVESALALCRVTARNQDAEPDLVCDALLSVEKAYRARAKDDDGSLSRETLAKLDGSWRLVFTTGTVETQSKIGRKINYFPLRATQTFDTQSSPMAISNGIYAGEFPLIKFFGTFDWLEDRRRLEFDFDSIAVLGIKFDLPKGGAEQLGAATGLGAENNVKRAQEGKKAFFNWISADDEIATARGGGGGLALWRREQP